MTNITLAESRIATATAYFNKVDGGDPSFLDLMIDDVQFYFPKFGTGTGKAEFMECAGGLMGSLTSLKHDIDNMNFMTAGDCVIAEGSEAGVSKDGVAWPIEGRSEGRFCNVFEFEGELIKRMYIYVDPDFTSTHSEKFLWGDTIRTTQA